ncbi:Lsr2 family protein [Glycomyces sp. A-F 0318]|uniref:histone-like nucleoid-structuring protein Lsr2 n=1 Tax=Glycomyces amatae TaxID=2881355 RepID=UPI001E4CD3C3|nr:Lsr2 family protein [Glycomyces amatae]MCD0446256.1 Lsr2 family protein [Glycomyces amatae]
MAKQRVIQLIDDLDQGPADETIRFAIDEQVYEIDLSHMHATELRAVFDRYREHGRRIGRVRLLAPGERPGPRRKPADRSRNARIRAWAAQHDYRVQPQGRIPNAIVKLYEAAQGTAA